MDTVELEAYCRYIYPRVFGALRHVTGDNDAARDLAQETLVRVVQYWPRVKHARHRDAYVHRIAMNLSSQALRQRRLRQNLVERLSSLRNDPRSDTSDPLQHVAMQSALQVLSHRQRVALTLRYFLDLSVDETAVAMRCRPGTVKALTHQGIAALRATNQWGG